MRKCYGAPVAKTKGKSRKGKAVAKAAGKPKKAKPVAKMAARPSAKPPRSVSVAKPARPSSPAKPARAKVSLRPSLPLPPPPPAPPPVRDELAAPRDVARLTRYGERFGARRIDVRWLPLQLPVTSGALAIVDPAVPKSWRVFDRPVGAGQFRAMLSIAKSDDGKERLAALTVHTGRPPIARWTVAHYKGQKTPKSPDQLPRVTVTSGFIALVDAAGDAPGVIAVPSTPAAPDSSIQPIEIPLTDGRRALVMPCDSGEHAAYWAVDEADKPIALVVDFDVFTQKEWKARPT